jgi:hypothetical protein
MAGENSQTRRVRAVSLHYTDEWMGGDENTKKEGGKNGLDYSLSHGVSPLFLHLHFVIHYIRFLMA